MMTIIIAVILVGWRPFAVDVVLLTRQLVSRLILYYLRNSWKRSHRFGIRFMKDTKAWAIIIWSVGALENAAYTDCVLDICLHVERK